MGRRKRISRTEVTRQLRDAAAEKKAVQRKKELAELTRLHREREQSRARVQVAAPSSSTQKIPIPSFAPPIPELHSIYTPTDGLHDGGVTDSRFGDEVIQLGAPIDPMHDAMHVDVEQQRDSLDITAGPQPLIPGRVYGPNKIDKGGLWDSQEMDHVVHSVHPQPRQKLEARQAQGHATNDYSDKVKSEVDLDVRALAITTDDHYPSGSDVGEGTDSEGGLNKTAGDVEMDKNSVKEDWLIQGATYLNNGASES